MTVDINNKSGQRQLTVKSTQNIYLLHTIDSSYDISIIMSAFIL